MKISKLFHWLYFSVMMLPIFILPIFALAVRSDNNFSPISIDVQEKVSVDFNQKMQTNNVSELNLSTDYIVKDAYVYSYQFNTTHKYLVKCRFYDLGANTQIRLRQPYISTFSDSVNEFIFTPISTNQFYFQYRSIDSNLSSGYLDNIQLFDLTQMGLDDITIDEFNIMFPDSYYSYIDSENILVNKPSLTTYNDSDFASQMVYTMYHGVDKYFNYDNVFNFGSLYSWLQLTFFDGSASLGFFIFWHLLIYWLLTSLLWLLFDVLMYVPLLVHRWLDKASLS